MADKQPQLNGAFYGPAIPPAEQPRYRHHHHRGRSCCCCLFGIFWKILVALVVLAGLAILIFWLVVQPRSFKFYVTEANLKQFEYYSNNNTLHYDMVLNFTARNPNKKLSIYYDKVEAVAFYEGTRFANYDVITHLNSFRQYKKTTSPMSAVFTGPRVVMLDNDQVSKLNQDKIDGVYDIYVRLYFRIRYRLGDVKSGDYKPKVKCDLRVPFTSNNTVTLFVPTKCKVDY
ncbi:NDR1/HIN1-like protein 10 [Abrus precatorius]|uniref:NDR1/HIN1-like protein 10 n=1 Tax=Abrus precatorius TaxID=3816 RepID=A0A8B8LDY4_ABRPR|nr:NDR1/HIN1-like protein 10 [Abrus precatorius]